MPMNKKEKRPDRGFRDREFDNSPMRKRVVLDPNTLIDENDVESLRRFVTEYGKIIPCRISGVTAAQQRQIKRGIRRARNMGLLA
jgi:small subunit ribosomal protein S18